MFLDGLHGFSKICRLNPQWMNEIEKKVREFEADSIKESQIPSNSQAQADSTVKAFRSLRDYYNQQARQRNINPNAMYKYELLTHLLNDFRSKFVALIKGNAVQQEYCACEDYARFFYYMSQMSSTTRQNYYGVENLNFQDAYISNLKSQCTSRCESTMKKKGFSAQQIALNLKNIQITVALSPGDKNDNRDIAVGTDSSGKAQFSVQTKPNHPTPVRNIIRHVISRVSRRPIVRGIANGIKNIFQKRTRK
jgi:hypothetical protein